MSSKLASFSKREKESLINNTSSWISLEWDFQVKLLAKGHLYIMAMMCAYAS